MELIERYRLWKARGEEDDSGGDDSDDGIENETLGTKNAWDFTIKGSKTDQHVPVGGFTAANNASTAYKPLPVPEPEDDSLEGGTIRGIPEAIVKNNAPVQQRNSGPKVTNGSGKAAVNSRDSGAGNVEDGVEQLRISVQHELRGSGTIPRIGSSYSPQPTRRSDQPPVPPARPAAVAETRSSSFHATESSPSQPSPLTQPTSNSMTSLNNHTASAIVQPNHSVNSKQTQQQHQHSRSFEAVLMPLISQTLESLNLPSDLSNPPSSSLKNLVAAISQADLASETSQPSTYSGFHQQQHQPQWSDLFLREMITQLCQNGFSDVDDRAVKEKLLRSRSTSSKR